MAEPSCAWDVIQNIVNSYNSFYEGTDYNLKSHLEREEAREKFRAFTTPKFREAFDEDLESGYSMDEIRQRESNLLDKITDPDY